MSEAAEPLEDPLTAQHQEADEHQQPAAGDDQGDECDDSVKPELQQQQEIADMEPDSKPESDQNNRPDSEAEGTPEPDGGARPDSDFDENERSPSDEDPDEDHMEDPQPTPILSIGNVIERAIEDEEMPSMVTISSSSRVDDSDLNPRDTEDQSPVKQMSHDKPKRDRNSDDAIVRQRNGSIRTEKERSSSLQDLSLIEGRSPHKLNPFSQKSIIERNLHKQERRPGGKYDHVESKVKGYINALSEQSKQSNERRMKAREEERMRLEQESEPQFDGNSKIIEACQTMKVYAARTLEEVAAEDENLYAMNQSLNGEISIIRKRPNDGEQQICQEEEMDVDRRGDGMDVDPIAVDPSQSIDTVNQLNGASVNADLQGDLQGSSMHPQDRRGIHRKDTHFEPIPNGEITPGLFCNQRKLTYEEYMKGSNTKDVDEEALTKEQVDKRNDLDISNRNHLSTSELRIESVTSNFCPIEEDSSRRIEDRDTPPMMKDQATDMHYEQSPEVTSLLREVDRQNSQFIALREVYQKTAAENMSMKAELHNLKNLVARHQPQKYSETIGTQTEISLGCIPNIDLDEESPAHRKLVASMLSSAVSSKWSDNTGSSAFTVEPPPDVTTALDSESASQQSKMSMKHKSAFSRAFVTSSKILQTLSSITYGRPKFSKSSKYPKSIATECASESSSVPLSQGNQTDELSNSRKRKAADTDEMSNSTQPCNKAMRTSKSDFSKSKRSTDPVDPDAEISLSHEGEEEEVAETAQTDEDVKVFVYPEDEAGKESSFLIQAKEVSDNSKGGVRECGPYLLGNVEVYMTEMDGTINIWGKELSQASTSQTVDDLESSVRSKDMRPSGIRWQSTPRIDDPTSSSSGKKSRVLPRFTHQQKQRAREIAQSQYGNYYDYRPPWSPHDYHPAYNPMMHPNDYGYRERRNYPPQCKPYLFYDERRHSFPDVFNQDQGYAPYAPSRCRSTFEQGVYRPEPSVRRHSFVPTDDEEADSDGEAQQKTPRNKSPNDSSKHSHSKLVPPPSVDKNSPIDSDDSSNQTDVNLLGHKKRSSDEPTSRNQRLSGGKVRGLLMDLLKGCGDCRNPDINKTLGEPSTSAYPENAYPPTNQPLSNRKSKTPRTKDDKATEIEAQLENFRLEMDKLRSRSDTLRDLLDELRNDDIAK
ncbi:hypothetical protein QAD02_010357 [Eretmocerus hayati]|uniref:Uncharacterized protein n=1 Tax=Eretmocerus hayati TaxID=131215 RepID=A0ACC2NBU2_9HYME|nr:hypothetical protein QAD02_010357 [Eretmocerus hayati]